MGTVININARRCRMCGGEGSKRELVYEGDTVAEFGACDPCLEKTAGELAAVRPVFDAMIAAGVSRDHANETMTFLLNLLHPDPQ
jgi:hypothetical protein